METKENNRITKWINNKKKLEKLEEGRETNIHLYSLKASNI